jgi:hypothetical protein
MVLVLLYIFTKLFTPNSLVSAVKSSPVSLLESRPHAAYFVRRCVPGELGGMAAGPLV